METVTVIKEHSGLILRVANDGESFVTCRPNIGPECPRTVAFVITDPTGFVQWMGCPAHVRQAGWFVTT